MLHLFSDASDGGHSAVAYARFTEGSTVLCSYMWGRARVNPLKQVSIPRLELVAALLAAKMRVRLCNEINIAFFNSSQIDYVTSQISQFNMLISDFLFNCIPKTCLFLPLY